MRKLARGVFGLSAGLALAGGGVLAFGQAQLVQSQSATAGDAAFSVGGFTPALDANNNNIRLLDNSTDTPVLTASISNVSSGQGQPEVITGSVGNITTPDTGCSNFIATPGNLAGKIGWASDTSDTSAPSAANSASPTLQPGGGSLAPGSSANVAVFLNLAPTGVPATPDSVNPTTNSACADAAFNFDLTFTSALP